jgi:hypothetical protein
MNQEKYIGMDVHDATISAAVKNAQGELLMECVLETKAATILEFIQTAAWNSGFDLRGRDLACMVISGPAQRSLKLRPARSRSRHATLSTESSDSFVASAAASIATGWSEPVPGREFHPLKSNAFHGALLRQ